MEETEMRIINTLQEIAAMFLDYGIQTAPVDIDFLGTYVTPEERMNVLQELILMMADLCYRYNVETGLVHYSERYLEIFSRKINMYQDEMRYMNGF